MYPFHWITAWSHLLWVSPVSGMSFEESQPIFLWRVFEAPPNLTLFWHRPCYTVQLWDFQWDSSQGFVLVSQLHSLWSSENVWSPGVMYVLGRCPVGGQSDVPDPVLQQNAWGLVSNSSHNPLSLWPPSCLCEPLTLFLMHWSIPRVGSDCLLW